LSQYDPIFLVNRHQGDFNFLTAEFLVVQSSKVCLLVRKHYLAIFTKIYQHIPFAQEVWKLIHNR